MPSNKQEKSINNNAVNTQTPQTNNNAGVENDVTIIKDSLYYEKVLTNFKEGEVEFTYFNLNSEGKLITYKFKLPKQMTAEQLNDCSEAVEELWVNVRKFITTTEQRLYKTKLETFLLNCIIKKENEINYENLFNEVINKQIEGIQSSIKEEFIVLMDYITEVMKIDKIKINLELDKVNKVYSINYLGKKKAGGSVSNGTRKERTTYTAGVIQNGKLKTFNNWSESLVELLQIKLTPSEIYKQIKEEHPNLTMPFDLMNKYLTTKMNIDASHTNFFERHSKAGLTAFLNRLNELYTKGEVTYVILENNLIKQAMAFDNGKYILTNDVKKYNELLTKENN